MEVVGAMTRQPPRRVAGTLAVTLKRLSVLTWLPLARSHCAARCRLAKPLARRPRHRVRAPSSASQHDTTRYMACGGGGVGLSRVQLTPADLAAAYAKAPWLGPCRGCRGVPSTAGCTMQCYDFAIGRPPARPIRRVRGFGKRGGARSAWVWKQLPKCATCSCP